MSEFVLETDRLRKAFGALVATDDVTLRIRRGETHALIGPNGAGKTTLVGQLTGELRQALPVILGSQRRFSGPPQLVLLQDQGGDRLSTEQFGVAAEVFFDPCRLSRKQAKLEIDADQLRDARGARRQSAAFFPEYYSSRPGSRRSRNLCPMCNPELSCASHCKVN